MEENNLTKIENTPKANKKISISVVKLITLIIFIIGYVILVIFSYIHVNIFSSIFRIVNTISKIFTIIYLLYRHEDAAYEISWILLIAFFGIGAVILYFLWGNSRFSDKACKKIQNIEDSSKIYLNKSSEIIKDFEIANNYDKTKIKQLKYMINISGFPIYYNDNVRYLDSGEAFFDSLKKDLKKAKESIYIEFYILSEGKLWSDILEILKEKAKKGVEVHISIDSLGSFLTKPKNFVKDMKSFGINVYIFNKISFNVSSYINFRNHRKIVVIDSNIAYVGGVNIADEYANIEEKYGYWKDTGVRLVGQIAFSFQMMILRNLEIITNKKQDYKRYSESNMQKNFNMEQSANNGFVMAYADGPYNKKDPCENIYIQTINSAKKYIYISTPYLILGETMYNTMLNIARSGVDVRIVVPHIPDKKMVQIITRSHYEELLEAGVKIYEFTPRIYSFQNDGIR